jgi:hypothetical protein
MFRYLLPLALLLAVGSSAAAATPLPATASADDYLRVSVWAEGGRDLYRSGDPLRIAFRTTEPAYVAIVHITPDGELDFLYPRSPWDRGYASARRNYSLYTGRSGWRIRGVDGIGYVYAIASRRPLDFRAFRDRHGGGWWFADYGRTVRGDPYYVFDRVADLLVPHDAFGGDYVDDLYVYHVGSRRHRYPRYACYDGYGYGGGFSSYWGSSYYYSCDALLRLLVVHPGYYYSRRPPRGVYLSGPVRSDPRYRFKEPASGRSGRTGTVIRPGVSSPGTASGGERVQTPRAVRPEVERPTLQRRGKGAAPERRVPEPRSAPRAEPRAEPARPSPRESPRAEPSSRTAPSPRAEPSSRGSTSRPAAPSRPRVGRPNGGS